MLIGLPNFWVKIWLVGLFSPIARGSIYVIWSGDQEGFFRDIPREPVNAHVLTWAKKLKPTAHHDHTSCSANCNVYAFVEVSFMIYFRFYSTCSTDCNVHAFIEVGFIIYYPTTPQYREIRRKIWSIVIFSDYMEPR